MYMYVSYVPSAHGGQERVLDGLKLELQTVVRNLIGLLGTECGCPAKAENALNPLSSFSCSMVSILNFISSSRYFY